MPVTTFRQTVANIFRLTSAAAIAQILAVAASPLISRLYQPSNFGKFAVSMAMITIILPVIALRYEIALPLPSSDPVAWSMLRLCLWVLTGITTILMLLSSVFGHTEVALTAGSMGLYAILASWLVRQHAFKRLAVMRVTMVLGTVIAQIMLALYYCADATGLILGVAIGYLLGVLIAAPYCYRTAGVRLIHLWRVATDYSAFAKWSAPSGALSGVGLEAINLAMPALYGPAIGGQAALAFRVVGQPSSLIGQAVSQVFSGDAGRLYVENPTHLWHLFWRLNTILMAVMVPTVLLTLFGGSVFAFVFGAEWREAGMYAGAMVLVQIIAMPVHATNSLTLYGKNKWMSLWDIGRLIIVALSFGIAWYLALSPFSCIILFCIVSFAANLTLLGLNALAIQSRLPLHVDANVVRTTIFFRNRFSRRWLSRIDEALNTHF